MIGLDTHVLVRCIMQDAALQAAKAAAFVETLTADNPGWISLVSLVELVWVLAAAYGLGRDRALDALEAL